MLPTPKNTAFSTYTFGSLAKPQIYDLVVLQTPTMRRGIKMSISKDLKTGDTKFKIGPEFGVNIDLSKKEDKGSFKVGVSGGVTRNYSAQYTSKETSTQK